MHLARFPFLLCKLIFVSFSPNWCSKALACNWGCWRGGGVGGFQELSSTRAEFEIAWRETVKSLFPVYWATPDWEWHYKSLSRKSALGFKCSLTPLGKIKGENIDWGCARMGGQFSGSTKSIQVCCCFDKHEMCLGHHGAAFIYGHLGPTLLVLSNLLL